MKGTQAVEIDNFKRLVAETAAWCLPRTSRPDPKRSLRTLPLNTSPNLTVIKHRERDEIVQSLFVERSRLLALENVSNKTDAWLSGRLLICYPEASVWDGAANPVSEGFVDDDDLPAWNTWCYHGIDNEQSSFLISWVPPAFIDLAQKAIEYCPTSCIKWASNVSNEFIKGLRAEGYFL